MKGRYRYRFRIHPAGLILWAAAFLFVPSYRVLSASAALLWHEACHLLTMLLLGVRQCCFEITPFGGMAEPVEFEKLPPLRQMLCALSGVLGSTAGLLICMTWVQPTAFVRSMTAMHLSLAAVNCLPVWPLDGARACVALAAFFGLEKPVRKMLAWLAVLTGLGMTALSLYGAWHGLFNPTLLFCGPYLCYAAREGYLSEHMRGICFPACKLKDGAVLPVRMYACFGRGSPALCARLLGGFSRERYHILLEVGKDGGMRMRTEDEMRDSLAGEDEIGMRCK